MALAAFSDFALFTRILLRQSSLHQKIMNSKANTYYSNLKVRAALHELLCRSDAAAFTGGHNRQGPHYVCGKKMKGINERRLMSETPPQQNYRNQKLKDVRLVQLPGLTESPSAQVSALTNARLQISLHDGCER